MNIKKIKLILREYANWNYFSILWSSGGSMMSCIGSSIGVSMAGRAAAGVVSEA